MRTRALYYDEQEAVEDVYESNPPTPRGASPSSERRLRRSQRDSSGSAYEWFPGAWDNALWGYDSDRWFARHTRGVSLDSSIAQLYLHGFFCQVSLGATGPRAVRRRSSGPATAPSTGRSAPGTRRASPGPCADALRSKTRPDQANHFSRLKSPLSWPNANHGRNLSHTIKDKDQLFSAWAFYRFIFVLFFHFFAFSNNTIQGLYTRTPNVHSTMTPLRRCAVVAAAGETFDLLRRRWEK